MSSTTQFITCRPTGRTLPIRLFLINTALLGSSVLMGLLLGEVMVRMAAPQQLIVPQPELYKADDVFGWRRRANVKTVMNTGEGLVRFRTDANGYRIPWEEKSGDSPRSGRMVRILTLGDSFLEATAVEAESTIPE